MQGSKTPTLAASSISKYFRFLCLIVSPPTPNLLQQYVILLVTPPVISQLLIAARWVGIVLLHHFTKHIPPTHPACACVCDRVAKTTLVQERRENVEESGTKTHLCLLPCKKGNYFSNPLLAREKKKGRMVIFWLKGGVPMPLIYLLLSQLLCNSFELR